MSLLKNMAAHARFARARVRALLRPGATLPPGPLDPSENSMYSDKMFYLDRFARYGPVFKTSWGRHILVCMSGNAEGRRFLTENQDRLRGISISLKKVFPKGFLRNLTGEEHKQYRRILGAPMQSGLAGAHDQAVRTTICAQLDDYCGACRTEGPSRKALLRCLNIASTRVMIRLLYGCPEDHPAFDRLCALHDALGPNDLVWRLDAPQVALFREVREIIGGLADTPDGLAPRSCLAHIAARDELDDTVFGNLVYMVEMGRYDLYGLLHWVAKYVSCSEETISALRRDDAASLPGSRISLARAAVMETLRMDQGEGVARRACKDITHEGYFYPEGTMFRMCLWDNHKNPETFPDPFRYDPTRFVRKDYGIEDWAPFGLDSHRCVGADLSLDVATMFVEELVRNYDLDVVDDGERIRGAYHWEPSDRFTLDIRLRPDTA